MASLGGQIPFLKEAFPVNPRTADSFRLAPAQRQFSRLPIREDAGIAMDDYFVVLPRWNCIEWWRGDVVSMHRRAGAYREKNPLFGQRRLWEDTVLSVST
jgi:hypothetical protein